MTGDTDLSRAEYAQIQALIEQRVMAVRAKDAEALTTNMTGDVVLFDAMGPLRQLGGEAERKRVAEWLALYRDGIDYEVRELNVSAGEGVAFCHYLYRVAGTTVDGTKVDMWLRATLGLCRRDGRWVIVHEHTSVPFDVTGAASMDLEP